MTCHSVIPTLSTHETKPSSSAISQQVRSRRWNTIMTSKMFTSYVLIFWQWCCWTVEPLLSGCCGMSDGNVLPPDAPSSARRPESAIWNNPRFLLSFPLCHVCPCWQIQPTCVVDASQIRFSVSLRLDTWLEYDARTRCRLWIPDKNHENCILYVFFWVFPRRPIVVCRGFGTLYQFHLQGLDVKYEVWHFILYTQKNTYKKHLWRLEVKLTHCNLFVISEGKTPLVN